MSNKHMEPLFAEAESEPVEQIPAGTPLDSTTEWIGVINRKREEAEQKKIDSYRMRAAKEREEAFRIKEAAKEEELRRSAEIMEINAKKHRNKIVLCILVVVLMLLLSCVSFALQYAGYIKFPWSIVITGCFGAVAAFFAGIVWDDCSKRK